MIRTKLTVEQRLNIYNGVKEKYLIDKNNIAYKYTLGLCYYLQYVSKYIYNIQFDYDILEKVFPEFTVIKPKHVNPSDYWFDVDIKSNDRLDALNTMIDLVKEKLSNQQILKADIDVLDEMIVIVKSYIDNKSISICYLCNLYRDLTYNEVYTFKELNEVIKHNIDKSKSRIIIRNDLIDSQTAGEERILMHNKVRLKLLKKLKKELINKLNNF